MITSKNNTQVKNIRKLMESSKERSEKGLFIAEGKRLATETPKELLECLFASETYAAENPGWEEDCPCEILADDVFRSLSDTVNPQGLLAVVRQPSYSLSEIAGKERLFVLLDDIRDPGNLGTIVRTAEAAGACVIMSPGCADIFNPKVIRATMGSIYRVPFVSAKMTEAVSILKENRVLVCAAALDGSVPYREVEYKNSKYTGTAFIIGNEANGVSPEVQKAADIRVRIPMQGMVESLNAAVSAAVLLYNIA